VGLNCGSRGGINCFFWLYKFKELRTLSPVSRIRKVVNRHRGDDVFPFKWNLRIALTKSFAVRSPFNTENIRWWPLAYLPYIKGNTGLGSHRICVSVPTDNSVQGTEMLGLCGIIPNLKIFALLNCNLIRWWNSIMATARSLHLAFDLTVITNEPLETGMWNFAEEIHHGGLRTCKFFMKYYSLVKKDNNYSNVARFWGDILQLNVVRDFIVSGNCIQKLITE
jgi:hypothetical protein